MKKYLRPVLFAALLTLVIPTACGLRVVNGSGEIVQEDREVIGFESFEFSGFGRVIPQIIRSSSDWGL
jgi:hypothetical protein